MSASVRPSFRRTSTSLALGDALGCQFASVAVDEAGQGHTAVLGCDADGARIHLRIPLQLPLDGVADADVLFGHRRCGHMHLRNV